MSTYGWQQGRGTITVTKTSGRRTAIKVGDRVRVTGYPYDFQEGEVVGTVVEVRGNSVVVDSPDEERGQILAPMDGVLLDSSFDAMDAKQYGGDYTEWMHGDPYYGQKPR